MPQARTGAPDWYGARDVQVATAASPHSGRIRVLKFVLPLVAAGLLAVMIAWPRIFSDEARFALTYSDVSTVNNDLRMISPRFTGADSQDRNYVITADMATQDLDDREQISLDALQADLAMSDGSWLTVSASTGEYHVGKQHLWLEGRVDAYSDLGYEVHARTLGIDLAAGTLMSDDAVQGQGPLGTVRSNGLRVSGRGDIVRFIGGVQVTIFPQAGAAG